MVKHISGDFSALNKLLEAPRSLPLNRTIFWTQMAFREENNSPVD